jgi:RNA polymerase sigma-70 factor (ECF subfamily)
LNGERVLYVQPSRRACTGDAKESLSDSDLLEQCGRGDESAWRELVTLYTRRVFALAYRFTGRADQAEDLTQEIFVKVYQNLERYDGNTGAFSGWLMAVARNHAIDHYRRQREERERRVDEPVILELAPASDENPLRALEREERARLVHRGLRSLRAELREPLILFDLQGVPYEDIAKSLGVPLGTVKSRINRGRLELAKRVRSHMGGKA